MLLKVTAVAQTSLSYLIYSLIGNKSELLILVAAGTVYLLILINYEKLGQQLISGCCFTCWSCACLLRQRSLGVTRHIRGGWHPPGSHRRVTAHKAEARGMACEQALALQSLISPSLLLVEVYLKTSYSLEEVNEYLYELACSLVFSWFLETAPPV